MNTGVYGATMTDLYQLTMLQAYHDQGMEETAAFEMSVRQLPRGRNFLLAAGLEQVLEYLESLRFTETDLEWFRQSGLFRPDFVDSLAEFRFAGDVHALAEGTVFFANEPLLRVTAPLPQAQLVESRIINLLQFPTLVASKAARCVLVAPDSLLVDFGMRRAHGAEAGLLAARAAYLAGFAGTATVLAGQLYEIPVFGTMAHSYVLAHDNEVEAFRNFATANPDNVVLLIDTYNTEAGAEKVAALAPELAARGIAIKAVRLDSGNLAAHAQQVRRILDRSGLQNVGIFVSGNLDENALAELINAEAPINGFGIGTRLDVSVDVPYLDCAYKLQEYAGRPCRKLSEGKATWPGRRQVYRELRNGIMLRDLVTLEHDRQAGEGLLQPVMMAGRRLQATRTLADIRRHAADNLAQLPLAMQRLEDDRSYVVEIAPALQELADSLETNGGCVSPTQDESPNQTE